MTFVTTFLHNEDHPVYKSFCKFQANIPLNARFMATQSLENLCTFILRQPCWWAKECTPAQFFI